MLPHIKNSKAGINRQDPVFNNLFEVYFSIPEALANEFSADVDVLTEQVTKISNLGSLNKSPEAGSQKFMGTDRSFLQATVGETFHEPEIELNLNLREATDNYVFKLFKAWASLAYDIQTGARTMKTDHVADFLRVIQYNRAGDIFREVIFHDVMLTGVTGFEDYDYGGGSEAPMLTVKFRSDWADEVNA